MARGADYAADGIIRESNYAAREALSEIIRSREWHCWFTVTFKHEQRHPFTAISQVARCLDASKHDLITRAVVVAEPFRLSGWHCHGIMWNKQVSQACDFPLDHAESRFKRLGWSRLEPVRDIGCVSGYLSKYMLKQEMMEWDIFGAAPLWALKNGA